MPQSNTTIQLLILRIDRCDSWHFALASERPSVRASLCIKVSLKYLPHYALSHPAVKIVFWLFTHYYLFINFVALVLFICYSTHSISPRATENLYLYWKKFVWWIYCTIDINFFFFFLLYSKSIIFQIHMLITNAKFASPGRPQWSVYYVFISHGSQPHRRNMVLNRHRHCLSWPPAQIFINQSSCFLHVTITGFHFTLFLSTSCFKILYKIDIQYT